jgi:hypothetical protein
VAARAEKAAAAHSMSVLSSTADQRVRKV